MIKINMLTNLNGGSVTQGGEITAIIFQLVLDIPYVEEAGKSLQGCPVVFLHGGPVVVVHSTFLRP